MSERALPDEARPEHQPLIGKSAMILVPVHNASASIPLKIERADLSCSCVEIMDCPAEVGPGSTGAIICRYSPTAFDAGSRVILAVSTSGKKPAVVTSMLDCAPVPPFAGWPMHADARVEGGRIIVPITEPYAKGVVTSVCAFHRGTTIELPVTLEEAGVVIKAGGAIDADLVVCFGADGRSTWSGPVFAKSP